MKYVTREDRVKPLVEMPEDEFRDYVTDNLGRRENPDLWDTLLSPYLVRKTNYALTGAYVDIEAQLSKRRGEFEEYRERCKTQGPEGVLAAKRAEQEYKSWRTGACGFRRILSTRMQEARSALKQLNIDPNTRSMVTSSQPAKRVSQVETIFRLGWAIKRHREQCEAEDVEPEPHDEELWAALDEVTVQTGKGALSVAEYLADIAAKPDFVPPEEREESAS